MNTTTHCIFDMDGLLLDTEKFYTVAQKKILERFGKEFTWELKSKMMGKKALEAAQILIQDLDLQGQLNPEDFVTERETILDELFPTSELLPGVDRLLRHLKSHNVPICVATSSHRRHFESKTEKHRELFALFDHIITGDMVTKGKPNPEIFQTAASTWEARPEPPQCLVFEDAPSGMQAAVAAGMPCVMIPDPNLDASQTLGATKVLESMVHFDPAQFGLPGFSD